MDAYNNRWINGLNMFKKPLSSTYNTSKSLLIVFLFSVFLFYGCDDRQEELQERDTQGMDYLHRFFEQETSWAEAVANDEPPTAQQALDSMQAVVAEFQELPDLPSDLETEDSLYFNKLSSMFTLLHQLSDSVYPELTERAFLPREEYTAEEKEIIMQSLYQSDSLLQERLRELQRHREHSSVLQE